VATVYCIQETMYHDITSAMDFGNIEVLLPPGSQIAFSSGPTVRRMRRKLNSFRDGDYLLLIGDPAAIGIACAIAAEANNGKIRMLKWSKKEMRYFPVVVDLHEKGESDEQDFN